MKLEDVQLQDRTGFVIAKGRLSTSSKADEAPPDGDTHGRVLLSWKRNVTTVWPVTQAQRNEYGFYEASLGETGLAFQSLSLADISEFSSPGAGRRSLTRGGANAGALIVRENRHGVWLEKPGKPIQHYELAAEYGVEGLYIEISGQIAATEDLPGESFVIDMTIPWATLAVKEIRNGSAYWKFAPQGRPSEIDSVNRLRNPKKLDDLLLSPSLHWPYLRGQISFPNETVCGPIRGRLAHEFVEIHFNSHNIVISEASELTVLHTGFAMSRSATYINLVLAMFDRKRLEAEFRHRNAIFIRLEGDAIGSIRYVTGYAEEPGDPLGHIGQSIKAISLNMVLGKDGLEISADGSFDDFDPREFALHREMRNSQLKPLHTFAVRAIVPWALLIAREFGFAYRARNF